MEDTNETTEFFVPTLRLDIRPYIEAEQKQGIHHVGRYRWAEIVLRKRTPATVLDVACGAGYGSYILARALPDTKVTRVDYDERAVSYARKKYRAPNLQYCQGDMVRWTSAAGPLGTYDAITSFDTIEHLLHKISPCFAPPTT
jgi:2-polyprenyl-3-methyl-5-hydroxy-6-metoxy-1,4-benzoquinol methylase